VTNALTERALTRDEIPTIWTIDRREIVHAGYVLEDGKLALRPMYFDVQGWPPGESAKYTPMLVECHDHGGVVHGLFDGARLIGAAILEARFIGRNHDQLQLKFLHVSRDYRHRGLGQRLFAWACREAERRGARSLYVSATPSQHTIDFYLQQGCTLAAEPDAALLALEPDDIHLERSLAKPRTATTDRG